MKRKLQLLAFLFLAGICTFLLFNSCKDNDSNPAAPMEPDSSSSDFVWEEISIGYDHSVLKDVYALNDTDVWAVGHLNTVGSGSDLIQHNALHWDGRTWSIVDVPVPLPGTTSEYPDRLAWVFAFNHDDVWFSAGGIITFWDGSTYTFDDSMYDTFPTGSYRMWGKTRNDVFIVGGQGALAHYNGRVFRKLDSGVPYDINDIWGVGDTALAVASNVLGEESASYVLRLVNGKAEKVYSAGLPRSMKAIWFCKGMRKLTAVGGYYVEWTGSQWQRQGQDPLSFYRMGIRGNSPVDYFVLDQATGIAHYNGKRWTSWKFGQTNDNMFFSLSCTKNQVWVVGVNKIGRTLILHGKRK